MKIRHPLANRVIVSSLTACMLASAVATSPAVAQQDLGEVDLDNLPRRDRTLLADQSTDVETVAVLAVESYDDMIQDINFFGQLADRPEIGQMLEGFIALFTQGRGLNGLDKSQPWGVLVRTDGVEFMPVGCLPIQDLDELTMLVEQFGIQVNDLDGGILEIELPDKPSLFVRSEGDWAFVSSDTDYLDELPSDPAKVFSAHLTDYDTAIQVAVQKVPESYRQMAVEQLRAGLEEGLEREDDETEEEFQMRRRWSENQLEGMVRLIEELDELNLGWALEAEQQRLHLDIVYQVVPGGKLDQTLASMAENAQTNYAGFYQPDAAVCSICAQKTDPELIREEIENFKVMLLTARKQFAKKIDEEDDLDGDPELRAGIKQAANDLLDAVEATIETGQFDLGGVVNLDSDAVTLVAGGYVSDTAKVESAAKKLVTLAKQKSDFAETQWDAETHGDVHFHTAQLPIDIEDEEPRQMFGPTLDISLGIGDESVYVGLGHENLAAVKGVIDASQAQPNKEVPVGELLVSVGQILQFSAGFMDEDEQQQKIIVQSIADMLRNEAQGRDHVRIVTQTIEHGLRYRVEAEEGVLKAIGKAIDVAQQAASTGGF